MSSTYVHYSAPSSLPSDYALLSRYASARPVYDEPDESAIENDVPDQSDPSERVEDRLSPRRSSFPTEFIRPLNPTLGSLPVDRSWSGSKSVIPSENTPLLGPLVPRIEEEVEGDVRDGEGPSARSLRLAVYWEETKILSKYTLPVFG